MAERDRRAGRVDVAVASLGEATEWPARVVLALARLSDFEANETRRILEEGLDLWAEEVGLDSLDESLDESEFEAFEPPQPRIEGQESELDRPIDNDELERAFAEAEAQTDEMLDVNQVAEHVLMSESAGLASLAGDDLVPSSDHVGERDELLSDVFGMDAAVVPDSTLAAQPETANDVVSLAQSESVDEEADLHPSRGVVLATLGRWLENIEEGRARRAQ